jgi:hypothetical protein
MKPANKLALIGLVLALGLLIAPLVAPAELIPVGPRTVFLNNDFVDWGNFGPSGTTVPSGSTIASSVYGFQITLTSKTGADFARRDQGTSWSGDFAPGDPLLWTNGANGYVLIEFPVDIIGAGLQLQPNTFTDRAVSYIYAYDRDDHILGGYAFPLTPPGYAPSTGNADNTAIFAGMMDSDAKIRSILIETAVDFATFEDFAFNQLDFFVCPCAVPVPLPGAVFLLGSGPVGLAGWRLRLQKG